MPLCRASFSLSKNIKVCKSMRYVQEVHGQTKFEENKRCFLHFKFQILEVQAFIKVSLQYNRCTLNIYKITAIKPSQRLPAGVSIINILNVKITTNVSSEENSTGCFLAHLVTTLSAFMITIHPSVAHA